MLGKPLKCWQYKTICLKRLLVYNSSVIEFDVQVCILLCVLFVWGYYNFKIRVIKIAHTTLLGAYFWHILYHQRNSKTLTETIWARFLA